MFEEMPESAFPEFLAAFWEEKDWETSVTENKDGTYMVTGDKDTGTRGLIGVRPDDETEIGASEVENFAAFCEKREVDVRVMATRGRFTTGARSAADSADVHLLDPNELASAVRDEGVEHLVDDYLDDGGDDEESVFDRLPAFPVSVPSGVPSGIPVAPIVAAVLVVTAAVFVGPTLLGMIPVVGAGGGGGGGGSSGPAVTAMSLAETNNTTATMRWDVTTQDSVTNYTAPEGQTFVVVQFNATAGESGATLRKSNFALAVNGSNQPVQEFSNMSNAFRAKQLPTRVGPSSSATGVVVFLAPEDFDGATLVETYDGPGIQFERSDLEFSV